MANPNTLNWIHYQDIQLSDINLKQQFLQYVSNGNYLEALNLLSTNEDQLTGKAFVANTINLIAQNILNLENRFNNNVPIFLSNLSSQYYNLINNLIKKSTWSNNIQYYPYNFVIYNQNIYMCIAEPPIGSDPSNTNYWLYLGLRGDTGAYGVNVNMKYDWNNTVSYQANDLVVYENNIYVALKNNLNVTPGTDNSTWIIFLNITPGEIYVGINPPTELLQNVIWFKTEIDPITSTEDTIITGQFNRYNTQTNNWEPMYPNTIFTLVQGKENYASLNIYIDLVILSSDWKNQEYIYNYNELKENNIVLIFPNNLNSDQYFLYNQLNFSIQSNSIIFSYSDSTFTPNVDLPILIKIQ